MLYQIELKLCSKIPAVTVNKGACSLAMYNSQLKMVMVLGLYDIYGKNFIGKKGLFFSNLAVSAIA